jgi:hypothetical protein
MTPEQLSINLNRVQVTIANDFPQWANVALGNTALAKLSDRIIKKGISADGTKYKPYSKRPMIIHPDSWSNQANLKKAYKEATYFTKNNKTYAVLPGGYYRQRQLDNNRQVDHKSFFYTGAMWGDIGVISTKPAGQYKFVTIVGARGPEYDEMLANHEKREGKEILAVSKDEEKELLEILDKYITNTINKAING